ncbi:MAG TPA: hypothetical protein VHN80_09625, partial [Kineosporiaceae bacterium]|nr:hypothetical protein [Kineosporiaceae bacterium]
MRQLSRTVTVAGFTILFAGVGPAAMAWAVPADLSPSGYSSSAHATSGADTDPAASGMPGMAGMAGMADATGAATPDVSGGSMPGMDDSSMPGMAPAHTAMAASSRPRTLVLGGFGVFNAGVLVAAAFVRRRT